MSNKYTSVYDWLKYIKANVVGINLRELRINPDVSPEDEGAGQMKMLYCSCPSEMRETLLHHTQETMKELTELSGKFKTN